MVVWSRLYFDLEPYLSERAADGTSLMTFYHRQLREVAEEEYLAGDARHERHAQLAAYFSDDAAQPLERRAEGEVRRTSGGSRSFPISRPAGSCGRSSLELSPTSTSRLLARLHLGRLRAPRTTEHRSFVMPAFRLIPRAAGRLGWADEAISTSATLAPGRSCWRNESANRRAPSLNRPTQASLKTMMLPE